MDVLRFATPKYGAFQKSAAAVELYLGPIAYLIRLKTRRDHLGNMRRVKLLQGREVEKNYR